MSDLKTFLKVAKKLGYPNPNPNSYIIANSIDYSLRNLIDDLLEEAGTEKTKEFVQKTFSSLGAMSSPGIKIDLGDRAGEEGSYIYLIINSFDINEGDEDVKVAWIHYTWGDSLIIDDEGEKTLDDIWDDVDMGSWGEYDDFLDEIRYECQEKIFRQTGIGIHFDSQI